MAMLSFHAYVRSQKTFSACWDFGADHGGERGATSIQGTARTGARGAYLPVPGRRTFSAETVAQIVWYSGGGSTGSGVSGFG